MTHLPTCLLIVTVEIDPAVEVEWNQQQFQGKRVAWYTPRQEQDEKAAEATKKKKKDKKKRNKAIFSVEIEACDIIKTINLFG